MEGETEKSFIGHFVSVISKDESRIEGTLSHLDLQSSLFILKNARCYGTEGRTRRERSEIPPCNEIRGHVLVRNKYIKDMELIFLPSDMLSEVENEFPTLSHAHAHSAMRNRVVPALGND